MFVQSGSAKNLQIVPVIKVTGSYTWSPATNSALNLNSVEQGKWVPITVPMTAFGASSLSDVREMLFQYWALSTPYAGGTIYFDNIRVDNDTVATFNTEGSAWFTGANAANVSLVRYNDVAAVGERKNVSAGRAFAMPRVTVSNKTVFISIDRQAESQVSLFDLKGKTAAVIDCRGLDKGQHVVPLGNVPAGPYIVEIRRGGSSKGKRVILR